jgi:hypothetical protein
VVRNAGYRRRLALVPFMRIFPFTVDNTERDIFVWWTSCKVEEDSLIVARIFDDLVCRCLRLVDEVRIKDIELYAGHQ